MLHLFWVVPAFIINTCEDWYSCVVYIWQIRVGSRRQQTHQCNRKLAGWFAVFCYNKVLFVPWSAFQTSRSGVNKNRHQTCTWLNGAGFPIALCFQTETQISLPFYLVYDFVILLLSECSQWFSAVSTLNCTDYSRNKPLLRDRCLLPFLIILTGFSPLVVVWSKVIGHTPLGNPSSTNFLR